MIHFRSPENHLAEFHDRVTELPWSYPQIGATRQQPPAGFSHDVYEVQLGTGESVFQAAREGLENWAMLPPSMARVYPANPPVEPGQVVVFHVTPPGVSFLGACRIVYRIDEPEGKVSARQGSGTKRYRARFGFAYGTLTEHPECGEVQYLVTWHADNRVTYRFECFSRPQHWSARLGYLFVRWQQRRFRTLSGRELQRYVEQHRERFANVERQPVPTAM